MYCSRAAIHADAVSSGFDAADGDELGRCKVSPGGYAHMTHMLSRLAGGRVVVALEVCGCGSNALRRLTCKSRVATMSTLLQNLRCRSVGRC